MGHIMNLDTCVIKALEYLAEHRDEIKPFTPETKEMALVVGSGNAILTGQYLHRNAPAVYANQDDYKEAWARYGKERIDRVTIVTASGGRDAAIMAEYFEKQGLTKRRLVTNAKGATARPFCSVDDAENEIFELPQMPGEPHTYNVSTYMAMLLANSGEDPKAILDFLGKLEIPRDLGDYPAYYILVPPEFEPIAGMFNVKFREIFGSHVYGMASTEAHSNHGLFVNRHNDELVIGLDVTNPWRGYKRWNIPMSADEPKFQPGPAMILAVGYYLIGEIQRRKPPWFRESLFDYIDVIKRFLGWEVKRFSE